jgi:hypothetical protein
MVTAGILPAASVPLLGLGFLLRKNSKNWKQPTSCRPKTTASMPFFAFQGDVQ